MTVATKSTAGIGSGGLATRAEVNPLAIPQADLEPVVSTKPARVVERDPGRGKPVGHTVRS